jgi:hypothetical protein
MEVQEQLAIHHQLPLVKGTRVVVLLVPEMVDQVVEEPVQQDQMVYLLELEVVAVQEPP